MKTEWFRPNLPLRITWKAEQTFFKCLKAQRNNKAVTNNVAKVQKNKNTQKVSLEFGATFLPQNCANVPAEGVERLGNWSEFLTDSQG